MSAYLFNFCRRVTDRQALEQYWDRVGETYTGSGRVLTAYMPFEVLEGDIEIWGVCAFEWPSMQDIKDWYYGSAYQEVKKLREGAQDNICVIVEGGFTPAPERHAPAGYDDKSLGAPS